MKNKLLTIALLSTVSVASFTTLAADEDQSTASITWSGVASIIPGENMTITGVNGSWRPNIGVLEVAANGTFSTSESVLLESHEYLDKDADGVKDIGELIATNWTLDPATPVVINWGENIINGMEAKIIDLNSGEELTSASGPEQTSSVSLAVTNESAVSADPKNPQAPLEVNATVIATSIVENGGGEII